jgi:hypothetical protein
MMNDELKQSKSRWRVFVWYFIALAALSAAAVIIPIVVNLNQQLTPEQLAEARANWTRNGPASYDLHYEERIDSEEIPNEYIVKVREGEVVSLRINGQLKALEAMTPQQRHKYTVPGLFEQIDEYLQEMKDGRRRNFAVAHFAPELGYPMHYIRRVRGSRSRLEWTIAVSPVKE